MFIPWLGKHLDARLLKLPKIGCSGASNTTGFTIRTHVFGQTQEWKTESYSKNNGELDYPSYQDQSARYNIPLLNSYFITLLILTTSPIALGLTLIGISAWMVGGDLPLLLVFYNYWLAAISIAILIAFLAIGLSRKDSKWREYHACEHKIAVLIESGLKPTLKNLKHAPSNLFRCGSSALISFVCAILMMNAAVIIHNRPLAMIGISAFGLVVLFLVNVVVIPQLLKKRSKTKFQTLIVNSALNLPLGTSFALLSALMVLPVLLQYFFFLRKPRESILQEGLHLAQRIQSSYQQ